MMSERERPTPVYAGARISKTLGSVRLVWRPHGNGWVYWVGGTSQYVFMAKYGYWMPEETQALRATGEGA